MSRFSGLARSGRQFRRESRDTPENPGKGKKPQISQGDVDTVIGSKIAGRPLMPDESVEEEVAVACEAYSKHLATLARRGIDVSHIPPLSPERALNMVLEKRKKAEAEARRIPEEEKLASLFGVSTMLKTICRT